MKSTFNLVALVDVAPYNLRMATQDEYIKTALRLPRDLHTAVQEAAERAGRSMNAEIIRRLELSLAPWDKAATDDSPGSPIPDNARLKEMVDGLPPPKTEKDAIARQLALAVLRMTGRLSDEDLDPLRAPRLGRTKMLEPLLDLEQPTNGRSRTPAVPGVNARKQGLGAAPKKPRVPKPKQTIQKRKVVADKGE